jgi:hypothetical protein
MLPLLPTFEKPIGTNFDKLQEAVQALDKYEYIDNTWTIVGFVVSFAAWNDAPSPAGNLADTGASVTTAIV